MTKRILSIFLVLITILSCLLLCSCNQKNNVSSQKLLEQFNEYLSEINLDGTYEEINEKWKSGEEVDKSLDFDSLTGENGTLTLGTKSFEPFAFIKNGKYTGFTIDIAFNFCKRNNYKLNIQDFGDTNSMVLATSQHKCDFAGGTVSITDERKESVDFSLPYCQNAGEIVVRKEDEDKYKDIDSLSNHSVGAITGTIYNQKIKKLNSAVTVYEFNNASDLFTALENNKVDAIANDQAVNNFALASHPNLSPSFTIFSNDNFGFIFPKTEENNPSQSKLNKEFNDYIHNLDLNGNLKTLSEKWEENSDISDIDYSKLTGENGTVTMGIKEDAPFVFPYHDHYIGLTMDLAYNFCLEKKYNLIIQKYNDYDELLTCVTSGQCDFAGSTISITDERKKIVNYSTPYYTNKISVFCNRDNLYVDMNSLSGKTIGTVKSSYYPSLINEFISSANTKEYDTTKELVAALNANKIDAIIYDYAVITAEANNFPSIIDTFTLKEDDSYGFIFKKEKVEQTIIESISSSFNKTFIKDNRWKLFINGIITTLIITLSSVLLGTIFGFLVFLMCRKGNKVSNAITNVCKWIIEGLPGVVLLMIFYYVIFGLIDISGLLVSIIVFTLIFAASVVSMLRTAVDAIDTGQKEGGLALGYTERKTFYKVILPQAILHVFEPYKSSLISLIKGTSIVGYIAVQDLTKITDMIRSSTYEAFFPLIVCALLYFLITWLFTLLLKGIQIKSKPNNKKAKRFLKGVNEHD